MTEEGKYIYCVIQTSRFAPCNSSGIKKEDKDHRFSFLGINNREVALLHYKDIAVVVSNTPVINFDRLDKEKLTRYATCHQKVNEEVMKDYDVVPMAFGIIAPSVGEVLRILERAYLQFKTALKNVAGKAEFVVQGWWNPQKILEELANTNLEIQKLKQELSSKGTILGMLIKLKLGKLIAQKMEQKRQTFINDVQASFGNLSLDFTSNKLIDTFDKLSVNPEQGRRIDDEMIVNLSLLIEKVKEPELDKKMQELGKRYEGKLRFKYIGPMPSYSFVNINLSLGNFEIVNEARKLLGLGEKATFFEIQKVYHILAHQYHPDKHQADADLEKFHEQIKKINRAYSILKSYCQSPAELAGKDFDPNQKYSFKENDIKKSILIH